MYLTECLQFFPYIFMKSFDLVGEIWQNRMIQILNSVIFFQKCLHTKYLLRKRQHFQARFDFLDDQIRYILLFYFILSEILELLILLTR